MILKTLHNNHRAKNQLLINSIKQQYRCVSSNKSKCIPEEKRPSKKDNVTKAPEIPSFMPVINIPVTELAHNAFYSLHRPLLGLSIPQPFLVGNMVGQITNDEPDTSEEDFLQYMSNLKPFEPPSALCSDEKEESTTTTLTVEVDPSYFLNHNNNHDEIADYLTSMQEKLDSLSKSSPKKKLKRLRKRKAFHTKIQ